VKDDDAKWIIEQLIFIANNLAAIDQKLAAINGTLSSRLT
jgi:hypothetical protein